MSQGASHHYPSPWEAQRGNRELLPPRRLKKQHPERERAPAPARRGLWSQGLNPWGSLGDAGVDTETP